MRDRALSNVVNYALMLGIVSLVVSGLVFGVGNVVENQQQRAIQSELTTIGHRLAEDVETVDRMVAMNGGAGAVELRTTVPDRVAGSGYRITITAVVADRYVIVLESIDPEVRVHVALRVRTDLSTTTVRGSELTIRYDEGSDAVVVSDD